MALPILYGNYHARHAAPVLGICHDPRFPAFYTNSLQYPKPIDLRNLPVEIAPNLCDNRPTFGGVRHGREESNGYSIEAGHRADPRLGEPDQGRAGWYSRPATRHV